MLETSLRILSWRTGRAPAEGHPQVGTLQGNVTPSHEERLGVCWEQTDTPAPSPTLGRAVLGEAKLGRPGSSRPTLQAMKEMLPGGEGVSLSPREGAPC